MANEPHSSCARSWASTFALYTQLNQSLNQAPARSRGDLERQIVELQDCLMAMPAPDLAAAIEKLRILWEVSIVHSDQTGHEKRQIVQDLLAIQATA